MSLSSSSLEEIRLNIVFLYMIINTVISNLRVTKNQLPKYHTGMYWHLDFIYTLSS